VPLVRHRVQQTYYEQNLSVWYDFHDGHTNCLEKVVDPDYNTGITINWSGSHKDWQLDIQL